MEKHEILSMKNCHRAATVQQIANPEYGVWKFEWRGQKLGGNAFYTEYAHIASKPCFGNATVTSASNCSSVGVSTSVLNSSTFIR